MDILDKPHSEEFYYMFLGRLQQDCEYYLNYGNRNSKVLWAKDEQEHIQLMLDVYSKLDELKKPEWLSLEDILEYKERMV